MKETSNITFYNNEAIYNGGSVFSEINSNIYFEERCTATFDGNIADGGTGGAISTETNSSVEFKDSCTVKFHNNNATQGGAIYSSYHSNIVVNENSIVTFTDNVATFGGALNFHSHSFVEDISVQLIRYCTAQLYIHTRTKKHLL